MTGVFASSGIVVCKMLLLCWRTCELPDRCVHFCGQFEAGNMKMLAMKIIRWVHYPSWFVAITVTGVFILCTCWQTDGTSQNCLYTVCILVSPGWLEQKCFQLAKKSSGRSLQLWFCWQLSAMVRCSDRESPVANSSACPRVCDNQHHVVFFCLQCFDAVGWATGRACK